jgi:hypothetical protein
MSFIFCQCNLPSFSRVLHITLCFGNNLVGFVVFVSQGILHSFVVFPAVSICMRLPVLDARGPHAKTHCGVFGRPFHPPPLPGGLLRPRPLDNGERELILHTNTERVPGQKETRIMSHINLRMNAVESWKMLLEKQKKKESSNDY